MADLRYAIYFVPRSDSRLYRFGAAALGYDCYEGGPVAYPQSAPKGWAEMTEEPRRYGFHATLHAPFRLVSGASEDELIAELPRFAERAGPPATVDLRLHAVSGFAALTPAAPCEVVQQLAANCVTHFDRFRAPPSSEDLHRRRSAGLTTRQDAALLRWGYPYVFDDFQFHMTLTGPFDPSCMTVAMTFLEAGFAACQDARPHVIDRVALLRQDAPARPFRILTHAALAPALARI